MALSDDVLKSTGFKSSDPSNNDEMKGDTGPGPYEQFEMCRHADEYECKFKDTAGRCIFETCVMDNQKPPRVELWYYKCLICKRDTSAKPEEMRAPFCQSCIDRMNRAEELPHNCVICGRSVNSPAKLMFSGICDDCFSAIKQCTLYWKGHKRWKHWG